MFETRQLVLTGERRVEVTRGDLGAPLPDDHVVVRTYQASICGTDLTFYKGRAPTPGPLSGAEFEANKYPMQIGHEGGGEVVEVGAHVVDLKPGDFVTSCHRSGTMADYWVSSRNWLLPRMDGMSKEAASIGEPTACAVFAGMASGVQVGDVVAISGLGFAGQVILSTVRAMGAARVIALDLSDAKLETARHRGADVTINAGTDDPVSRIMDETHGVGVDVTIEASGAEASFNAMSAALRAGGIYGIYSWPTRPLTLALDRWHDDGFDLRVLALMHRRHDWRYWATRALRPVAQGIVEVDSLITHVFPISEGPKAFDTAIDDPSAVKVALRP